MAVSVSLVLLLALIVGLLVSKGGLKAWHALLCLLLGFYLASSSLAPDITKFARNVASLISGIRF